MRSSLLIGLAAAFVAASGVDAQVLVERINCGGGAVLTGDGALFEAEVPYVLGLQDGFVGGFTQSVISSADLIGGDDNPRREVFGTARIDWTAYRIEVPNGDYIVRLLLAEILNQGVGLREMSVSVEGVEVLSAVDLAQLHGVQYGAELAVTTTVADGVLDIEATPGPGFDVPAVEAALLCGLEVFTLPATLPGPSVPAGFTASPSYLMNFVHWDWNLDPTVAEVEGRRATAAGGPYTTIATLWSNPSRYIDESAFPFQTYYYGLRVTDVLGSSVDSFVLPVTTLDTTATTLPVWEISISPPLLEYISRNIQDNPSIEVPASFQVGAETWDVEVRFRGATARSHSKKSWKVKFPSWDTFYGREDLNLKASFLDQAMIRERLSFHLWDEVGEPGSEIQPVHLYVNGQYAGVYNEAEHIDEIWLDTRGLNDDASLYKVTDGNLMVLGSVPEYEAAYDKKTNKYLGHGDIIELVEFLDSAPSSSFLQELCDRVNVDAYLTYLAVVGWDGDIDTVNQNHYLSHDLDLDRWEVIPWDADYSWGQLVLMVFAPLDVGTSSYDPDPDKINQLRERALGIDALMWRYCEKVRELDALYANSTELDPVIAEFHGDVAEDVRADPYKLGWETSVEFDAALSGLQAFVPFRSVVVLASADALQPATPPTDVWINELVAATQSTFADGAGDFEDWVELYNDSGAPLDVSGMYLSNDLSVAPTWQLPASTVIPAGGHLIVFCDDETSEGPLHADFTLEAGGGELGLFDVDGTTLLDFISWRPQKPGISYGRYNDGKQLWRYLGTETPGAPNTTVGVTPPFLSALGASPDFPTEDDDVVVGVDAKDVQEISTIELFFTIDGGGFQSLPLVNVGLERYEAQLPPLQNGSRVDFYVTATNALGETAHLPEDAPTTVESFTVAELALDGLRISEILASNETVFTDPSGDFDDYVEIHNPTPVQVDMSGMYLTDDLGEPTQYRFPAGTTIPPGGHVLVWADDEPAEGPLHAGFTLGASGDAVGLFASDGTTLIDGFTYAPQSPDVAYGTLPDASANRFALLTPTPGHSNLPAPGGAHAFEYRDPTVNDVELAAFTPPMIGTGLVLTVVATLSGEGGIVTFATDTTLVDLGAHGFVLVPNQYPILAKFYVTNSSGAAAVLLNIPPDAGLVGLSFFSQSYTLNDGLSNGLALTIG